MSQITRRQTGQRVKLCAKRKQHLGKQHRLQVLLVDEWRKNKKQRLQGNGVGVVPSQQWLGVLESDWFVHVCGYVGPTGAYALCLLARTSRAVMQAMWSTSYARMQLYGMKDAAGARVPPMFSVMGYKRRYVAKTENAIVHPIPKAFRIVAPSRLCRVCFGAQSAATHIKVKVGPHFASNGCTTVPVCEKCVLVDKAPAWTSVQVFLCRVSNDFDQRLLQVINMPTPVDEKTTKRRTACGWPTVLLGPLCRAAGLRDAPYAELAKHMARTLGEVQARKEQHGVARRELLDCAVKWGGLSVGFRRCLR